MTNQTNFSEIFGTINNLNIADQLKNSLFYIPDYQRNYDWSAQQIERLFIDYVDATAGKSSVHYVGSVLYNLEEVDGKTRLVVIDGQQRTTSILLMFLAIFLLGFKAAAKKSLKPRNTFLLKFNIDFLEDLIENNRLVDLIRYDYDQENERFLAIVKPVSELLNKFVVAINSEEENEAEIQQYSQEIDALIKQLETNDSKNRFQNNFLSLYKLFEQECTVINENGEAELDTTKLQSLGVKKANIEAVFVEIKNQDYAISVFNAINTTGVKLSDAELIRAYLICHNTQAYADVLDDIEQEIKEYSDSFPISDNSNVQKIYSNFFDNLIRACQLRTGKTRYRSWFKDAIVSDRKVKSKNEEFKIYSDFKLAYDKLGLRDNPQAFAQLIKRYFGYFKFVTGFTPYKDNEFFKSLGSKVDLNSKDVQKFLLIIRGFKDYSTLAQYMPDFFVLMERIDPRISLYPDLTKLESLEFKTCLRVMHLLWSFVIRASLNQKFYGSHKIGNTSINIATLSQDEIFEALVSQLNTGNIKTRFNDETLETFNASLISKKYQSKNSREFAYLLRIVHQNVEVCDVDSNLSADSLEHIMPQTLTPEWKASNRETTFNDWDRIKYMKMRSKPSCKADLDDDLMVDLFERFNNCLGNLLLLSKGKNSAASNKFFKDKLEVYKNDGYQFFVKQLNQKSSWGYADIIELTQIYGKYIFDYCSIDNPEFKDLDKK